MRKAAPGWPRDRRSARWNRGASFFWARHTIMRNITAGSFTLWLLSTAGLTAWSPQLYSQDSGGEQALVLEEVTVTATRRAESLMDVPISGFGGSDLRDNPASGSAADLAAALRADTCTDGQMALNGGTLRLGAGPIVLTTAGDVQFDGNTTLQMQLDGADAGTGFDQLAVSGANLSVDLGDASLELSLGFEPSSGTLLWLVSW